MCVGCSKGFEIVDLETLDTQGLLDPHDESLDFVRRRDNLRPMAIYRIHNEFLLCYDGGWSMFAVVSSILIDFFSRRICILCQQEWTTITIEFHGTMGRATHWLRYVGNTSIFRQDPLTVFDASSP